RQEFPDVNLPATWPSRVMRTRRQRAGQARSGGRLEMDGDPAFAVQRGDVGKALRDIGFHHGIVLAVETTGQDQRAAGPYMGRHLRGDLDERASQNVGEDRKSTRLN